MEILEFGKTSNPKIILIHGFESPYQIWEKYIAYYKKQFHVIVPILPGHNFDMQEDFHTLEECAEELEDYCMARYGTKIYAVYGMSMGGVLACYLWKNQRLQIEKLIMESSPLLPFGKLVTKMLTRQYLGITHKAQKGDKKTARRAVNTMVREEQLGDFMRLLSQISDQTIINYIQEVGMFKMPDNLTDTTTEITYFYGGKHSEILFQRAAEYIKKNYSNATLVCFEKKGHCEDALLNPEVRIEDLNHILLGKCYEINI